MEIVVQLKSGAAVEQKNGKKKKIKEWETNKNRKLQTKKVIYKDK